MMDKDVAYIFSVFCDDQRMVEYMKQFECILMENECIAVTADILKFHKTLLCLERYNLIRDHSTFIGSDNLVHSNREKLSDVLLNVLLILCEKYIKPLLTKQLRELIEPAVITSIFESVAILMKTLIYKIEPIDYVESLFNLLNSYIKECATELNMTMNLNESETLALYQPTLKFFAKLLKCIPAGGYESYIKDKILFDFLNVLPISDEQTLIVFSSDIFPALLSTVNISMKTNILQKILDIVSYFFCQSEKNTNCVYTLLCLLSEHLFGNRETTYTVCIHDNAMFWQIILSGLSSNNSFDRKRSLYVFKVLINWIRMKETFSTVVQDDVLIFFVKSSKDFIIWDDIITLFEILEEKQVHVIKPVLPKLIEVIHLTYVDSISSANENPILHTSWIVFLVKRMLCHESKYIIKQALSFALNLNFQKCPIHKQNGQLFSEILIEAVNNKSVFSRHVDKSDDPLFLSYEELQMFLRNYISAIKDELQKVEFMKYFLSIIASHSWYGIALLHLTFALAKLDCIPSWNHCDMIHIRKIVHDSQRTQEPVFRIALEYCLLECCILYLDWDSLCFQDFAEILMLFKYFYCHSNMWKKLEIKLRELISSSKNFCITEARKFCEESVKKIHSPNKDAELLETFEVHKIARMLLLMSDSLIPSPGTKHGCNYLLWTELLKPVISIFLCVQKRPYMPIDIVLNILQLIKFLIQESCEHQNQNNTLKISVIDYLQQCPQSIEFLYQKTFSTVNISHINIFLDTLEVLSKEEALKVYFKRYLPDFLTKWNIISSEFSFTIALISFWKILNLNLLSDSKFGGTSRSDANCIKDLNYKLLSKALHNDMLNNCLSKPTVSSKTEKTEWLEIASKCVSDFWEISYHIIISLSPSEFSNIMNLLLVQVKRTFESCTPTTVVSTIKCLKAIIPRLGCENFDMMLDLLDASWKTCLELHGNEAFRPSIKYLVKAVFQPEMLHEKYFSTLYSYIDKFKKLSENTLGIFYLVVKQFCSAFSFDILIESEFDSVSFFTSALIYGPIHHKCQKIKEETLACFIQQDKNLAHNLKLEEYTKSPALVRIIVIDFLLQNLYKKNAQSEKFASALINKLINVDEDSNHQNSSRFSNSYFHRLRTRIWQSILLLQPNICNENLNREFLERILESSESLNQQPSIRYLQEWILFKILYAHENLLDNFISLLEQSYNKRPALIISLLSVLIHLILHGLLSVNEILRCFPIIINYCMAQNFTVRLYARLSLMKLYSFYEKGDIGDVPLKYDFVSSLLQSHNSQDSHGNFFKNVQKLSNDFYFTMFHPVKHFTLETIFFDLPRLSSLTSEEWISPDAINEYLSVKSDLPILSYNIDDSLRNSTAHTWCPKPQEEIHCSETNYNFQKKICPWMDAISDNLNCIEESYCETGQKSALIVVASLVDRIPNLGGLCRTCEIFGVDELIIGSLEYVKDKQFQNLCVSADKWVSIKEIKPYHLKEYLTSLKGEGYSLIGLEQTGDSHKLTNFNFPEKSALLLGHEKEGLPVNLIQLLDACVEIPQQGIIRSLNVHVSGAICIWEYARQHVQKL